MKEHKSDFELTINTPYLALMGELWGVYCEDFEEKLLLYSWHRIVSFVSPHTCMKWTSINHANIYVSKIF